MTLTVITPPAAPPVSRADVKDHLRIGHDGEDGLVDRLINEATAWLETSSDMALIERRLKRTITDWSPRLSGRGWVLHPSPAAALISIEIKDADGAVQDTVTDKMSLVGGRLCLRPWSMLPPLGQGLTAEITFDAGFGTDEDVPPELQLAVKETVAHLYQTGGVRSADDARLSGGVESMVASYRRLRL